MITWRKAGWGVCHTAEDWGASGRTGRDSQSSSLPTAYCGMLLSGHVLCPALSHDPWMAFSLWFVGKKTISTFKNDDIEFRAIMTTHSNPFLSQQLWDLLGRVPWGCRKFPFLLSIAKFALLHVLGSSHSGTVPLIWCGVGPPFFRELWLLGRGVCERICRWIAVWFCGGIIGLCTGSSPISTLGNFGFSRESVGTWVCLAFGPGE